MPEKEAFVIRGLSHTMEILSFGQSDAEISSSIEKRLLKQGSPINKVDIFIAGICMAHDATIITLDRDFKKVIGLKVVEI